MVKKIGVIRKNNVHLNKMVFPITIELDEVVIDNIFNIGERRLLKK